MKYELDCSHVDTCLPAYVLDHCSGDTEMLVGVPVDRLTRIWRLRRDLASEVAAYGDNLPEEIDNAQVEAAIAECFAGAHPLATYDSSLEAASEGDECCQAWFRFTWEEIQ